MFTGIIEELGTVQKIMKKENLAVFSLKAKKLSKGVKVGASIAVNGVCLTVTSHKGQSLQFDIMRESLYCTTLGRLNMGDPVNLERALKGGGRFDGHFVTGHVDGVARILRKIKKTNYTEFMLKVPSSLVKYIVPKGSVCLDGVSLTIGRAKANTITVYLIPHTLKVTTFGRLQKSDQVNIETDILAKYILSES